MSSRELLWLKKFLMILVTCKLKGSSPYFFNKLIIEYLPKNLHKIIIMGIFYIKIILKLRFLSTNKSYHIITF